MFDSISPKTRAYYLTATVLTLAGLISWLAVITSTASTGTPSFAPATTFSVGANPHAVVPGAFNGDSKTDLAVANSGSANVSILLGDGAGGFGPATNFSAGLTPVSIAVGDFNSDSKQDLAVANNGDVNNAGDVSILLGDGAGNFGPPTNLAAGTHPYAVVAGDFSGDSKLDLAVANYDSNNLSIFLGDGTGGFSAPTNLTVGTNPRALALGDFNTDTKLDIAAANQGSNSVSILIGNGLGGFASATNFDTGTGPVSVATGDFNGDSKIDLAVANITAGTVSTLLGDGAGGFATHSDFAAGSSPYSVVVGDFYGDGKPDVAVANSGAGNVSVLLGNGTGSLGTAANFAVGTDPRILASGNFNSDNNPDLVVPNFGSNNISVLLNTSVVMASISGAVKDTQNNPIAGVTVEAINPSNQQVIASFLTDALGHYNLTVPLGTYDLKATPPAGSEFRPVTISGIAVTADIIQDIALARPTTVELRGRVTDRDGNPYANLTVLLTNTDPINHPQTTTDNNGNYVLRAEPATYTLAVNYFLAIDPGYSGSTTLALTQDTVRDIVIQNRTLSGTVRDTNGQPIANVTVKGCVNNTSFSGMTWNICNNHPGPKTDANGFYRMTMFSGSTALDVVPPQGSLFGQTTVAVDIQGDTTKDITLSATTVELRGRVTDRDGNPYANLTVLLTNTDPINHPQTMTDSNGNYVLRAEPATYTFGLNYSRAMDGDFSGSTTLTLAQDTVRDIVVQNRILSGTVRDASGQPIPNVTVKGCLNNSSFSGMTWTICNTAQGPKSDANGFYRMTIFPGSATLDVVPPQNSPFGQTTVVADIQGDTTKDITLIDTTVELRGRITDRDGNPYTNLTVLLTNTDPINHPQTTTAADGTYVLRAKPATYTLAVNYFLAIDPGYSGGTTLTLTQNTVRDIVIQNRTLSGTVRDTNGQPIPNVTVKGCVNNASFSGMTWNICNTTPGPKSDANGFYRMTMFSGSTTLDVVPPQGSPFGQTTVPVDIQGDTTKDIILQGPTHLIRGRITDGTGAALVGVTVSLTGSQSAISTTDGNGNYVFVNVSEGGSYTITPSRTSYQFTPANAVFNNLLVDQVANFTGTLVTYNVRGRIADTVGNALPGVTVTLSGPGTVVTSTDSQGNYLFVSVAAFANYSIKPSKPGLAFTPSRRDITNLSAEQTGQDFTGAPSGAPPPPLNEDFSNNTRDPDKFQFGSLSTDATAFDPLVTVAQQNGHLEINPRADAFGTHYNGYTSVAAVDVNTSRPSVEVVQAAGGGAQTIFSLGADKDNSFGFMVQTGGGGAITSAGVKANSPADTAAALLIFQIKISGQLTALSIPYDPVAHRFWRFRYDPAPNAILFETSPDNTGWSVQHSVVLQKSVTPMAVELSSGTSSTTTNPGTAVFDNFHLGDKFSISGQVKTASNAALSGVTMNLNGTLTLTIATDSGGNYSFGVLNAGGNYTVTPSLSGFTFVPNGQTFNSLAANQTANFTANAASTPTPTPTPSPSPTPTPTPAGNTPVGSSVTVQGSGVEITFSRVNSAGITTMNAISPGSAGTTPGGYVINGSSVAFEISTSAAYTPPIDLCFAMPSVTDATAFNSLALLHNEGGVLVDRTVSRDFATKKVCGRVDSLSPFVVASKVTAQFLTAGVNVNEGGGSVTVTVTRTDTSGAATVSYRTTDTDTFTVGCADAVNNLGAAYGRCDYATSNDTLSFAGGEASKSFVIPIINDGHVEGPETFQVVLSNPTGLTLGATTTATVTINDNDTTNTNPILASDDAGIAFFVRQHYLDFLAREPEVGEPWSGILGPPCADQFNFDPTSPSAACDRLTVSGSFFGSPEFLNKGIYTIVFYRVAFNRLPQYVEFAPDLRSVTGSTGPEAAAKRATFANSFVLRPEFVGPYAGLSNQDYVNALMVRYGTSITTPDPANPDGTVKMTLTTNDLTNRLNGVGGTLTRAQVLRAIVQSDQVSGNLEAVNAFVASQYYGYLRRTPDTGGFNSWVTHLSQHPNDFRTMVNGFVNSIEYRLRFGP